MPDSCRPVVEHLAAFVANSLAPPKLTPLERHLRKCHDCQEREAELDHLDAMLAPIAVPVPPTLVAMATSRWKATANAATVVPRTRVGLLSFPTSRRKPLAGAALAVMGLGIIGAAVVSGPLLSHGPGFGGLAPAAAAPTEVNQSGASGAGPFLLSGSQTPAPTTSPPTTSTSTTVATSAGSTATTAGGGGGGGKASTGGGGASTAGLLPGTPSAPSPTTIVPRQLPAPLPPVTLPPATLPPATVPPTLLPKITAPKLLP